MKRSVYGIHPSVERWAGNPGMPPEYASPAAYLATAERYVDEMFAGPKAACGRFSSAAENKPVSRRGHEGLSLQDDCSDLPPPRDRPDQTDDGTRIDFGLALGNTKAPKRLINTGGFMKKDRITHRIEIMSIDDIDDELKRWLKKAYEMDA